MSDTQYDDMPLSIRSDDAQIERSSRKRLRSTENEGSRKVLKAPSVWSSIGPIAVVRSRLWPHMTEAEIVRAMMCNGASYARMSEYPIRAMLDSARVRKYERVRPFVTRLNLTDFADLNDAYINSFPLTVLVCNFIVKEALRFPAMLSLTDVTFTNHFVRSAVFPTLPDAVTTLSLEAYEWRLPVGILPPSLTKLHLGDAFCQTLEPGALPQSLTSLCFGNEFNRPISVSVLPFALTDLDLGDDYNQEIAVDVLPASLTALRLGDAFNQQLGNCLPKSLKSLVFGEAFDQRFHENELPITLTTLLLGHSFNQVVDVGTLPPSLYSLKFVFAFNQPIMIGLLPSSLGILCFGNAFNSTVAINALPNSITDLNFGNDFDQPIQVGVLPSSLTYFEFGRQYNQQLQVGVLPDSITHLKFGSHFNQFLLPHSLPNSLIRLEFGYKFDQELHAGVLSPPLTDLTFGNSFNQLLEAGALPSSLTRLAFKDGFDMPLDVNVLPLSLTELSLGNAFDQMIASDVIPVALKTLRFGIAYTQPFRTELVPASCRIHGDPNNSEYSESDRQYRIRIATQHKQLTQTKREIEVHQEKLAQLEKTQVMLTAQLNDLALQQHQHDIERVGEKHGRLSSKLITMKRGLREMQSDVNLKYLIPDAKKKITAMRDHMEAFRQRYRKEGIVFEEFDKFGEE